ncbi:MAG: radical SAM family heme chaperone HemW [Erysipelotrichaceae bacterium]|nr:radical SAM family heme chaperone HemW [Erysipelotrichaceae bacterium]
MIKHLYVHIPFCKSICDYCDFCRVPYNEKLASHYLESLKKELEQRVKGTSFKTIYIGGGTPSALSPELLDSMLSLFDCYLKDCEEYTIEVNPETIDEEKVRILKRHGINRISMGVQTFKEKLLKSINRHHSVRDIERAMKLFIENQITNISIDLLYALPGQSLDDVNSDLIKAISLPIRHLSIYSLTIEENSRFGRDHVKPIDEDLEADMYELIVNYLGEHGFDHYEISNFSLPGYRSLHNLGYWRYEDYYGIGLGATSKIDDQIIDNTRNFISYFKGEYYAMNNQTENKKEIMFNHIMMSLRTSEGLDIPSFNLKYHTDFMAEYQNALVKNGDYLTIKGDKLICTKMSILNEILLDFMD